MFKELVFYLEACESGSMFENLLPSNLSIFATTASNSAESSWGTYCAPQDLVNGKEIGSCLGDLYSVNWMENSDVTDMSKESLEAQFQIVQKLTDKSHVMQFGSLAFDSEPIADFQTTKGAGVRHAPLAPSVASMEDLAARSGSAVSSRDVPLHTLYHAYLRAPEASLEKARANERVQAELASRSAADSAFQKLALAVMGTASGPQMLDVYTPPTQFDCARAVNDAVEAVCGRYTDYSLKYTRVVVNLCEAFNGEAAPILKGVSTMCSF